MVTIQEMKKIDVVGIGICVFDFLMIVPERFKADTRIFVPEFTMQGGGPIGTALVALARLGAKVLYLDKLADDQFGHILYNDLRKEGIDTSRTIFEKGVSSRIAFILVHAESGKRTIIVPPQYSFAKLRKNEVDLSVIKNARILHIDQSAPDVAIEASEIARENGIMVVLGVEGMTPETRDLIEASDVLISDEIFLQELTKEKNYEKGMRKLGSRYSDKIIVVTAGIKGSYVYSKGKLIHAPAFKIRAVDTTGAGDVYHGAFIYGLLKGWDLEYTARFSSAVSALKCLKLGGRAGIPSLKKAKQFLK